MVIVVQVEALLGELELILRLLIGGLPTVGLQLKEAKKRSGQGVSMRS